MKEDGSIQVIPISEEYRRNYDRIFGRSNYSPGPDGKCTVERASLTCACCCFNKNGECTVVPEKEDSNAD